MPDRHIQFTDVVDTVHGIGLAVYHYHGGVRINIGMREYMLDREAASRLHDAIGEALSLASLWEAKNTDD